MRSLGPTVLQIYGTFEFEKRPNYQEGSLRIFVSSKLWRTIYGAERNRYTTSVETI